jgi:hypothetical protein
MCCSRSIQAALREVYCWAPATAKISSKSTEAWDDRDALQMLYGFEVATG